MDKNDLLNGRAFVRLPADNAKRLESYRERLVGLEEMESSPEVISAVLRVKELIQALERILNSPKKEAPLKTKGFKSGL